MINNKLDQINARRQQDNTRKTASWIKLTQQDNKQDNT